MPGSASLRAADLDFAYDAARPILSGVSLDRDGGRVDVFVFGRPTAG